MKPPAAWLELSLVAAGLMGSMVLVMWAQRPVAGCTLSFEKPQVLLLSRETDREHLATDLASAARIARRYALSTAADGHQPGSRLADCKATLTQQIAARHGLSPDHVRSVLPDTP